MAILVGDAPSVNEKYVPVYNAYNGQTETMETNGVNLKKMEEETFSKIVMGKADISEFDTFVENWKSQGGDQILKEINEELSSKAIAADGVHQPLFLRWRFKMRENKVVYGLIGYGGMGRWHTEILSNVPKL